MCPVHLDVADLAAEVFHEQIADVWTGSWLVGLALYMKGLAFRIGAMWIQLSSTHLHPISRKTGDAPVKCFH